MRNVLLGVVLLSTPIPVFAQAPAPAPGPVAIANFLYWWVTEGGPEMQDSVMPLIGGRRFEGAQQSARTFVANNTSANVVIYLESTSCENQPLTIPVGELVDVGCDSSEGDQWNNLTFNGESGGFGHGDLALIEMGADGAPHLADYSEHARAEAIRQGYAAPRPQTEPKRCRFC